MKNPIRPLALTSKLSHVECEAVDVYAAAEPLGKVFGFGGAFTEAAGWCYAQLPAAAKARVIRDLFDEKKGLGYRFCRIPMGSCDFALDPYSLSEKPDLADFSIAQDRKFILPFVKDALKVAGRDLFLFASPWSPPAFMKDTKIRKQGGRLLPRYRAAYAQLFVKFLKAYKDEGVDIRAVTVQNEPAARQSWESCQWTGREEGEFAVKFLRPALDKAGLKGVKILVWDHNKERLFERACASMSVRGADKAIWGFGYHWYSGDHFDAIAETARKFAGRPVLGTENCSSIGEADTVAPLAYALEYCEDLRHGSMGACDWNMLLTEEGGPYHDRYASGDSNGRIGAGCAAPLLVNEKKRTVRASGIFGAIAPIACNFRPGDAVLPTSNYASCIHSVAARKPDGSIVLLLVNADDRPHQAVVRHAGLAGRVELAPKSVNAFALKLGK